MLTSEPPLELWKVSTRAPLRIPFLPYQYPIKRSNAWPLTAHRRKTSGSASGVVKMRKPNKRCKGTDANHYWNHSDEQEMYFFKVMTNDFGERLGIPDKFVQQFRGRIAKTVKLESRTGCTFDVEVTKSLDKVVFQTGWEAFVCAHNLKMGDFLVFRYDGTSRMKVWIFDLSCCEKVPPCHAMISPIRGGGKGEEQSEISGSCDDLPMKSTQSKMKAWKQREGIINLNTSSTSSSDSSGDSFSPEGQESCSVRNCILPQRTYLTCVQKKKLKERVRDNCSKTPIFGCVMKKSSIDAKPQTLDISREYADVYLPFEDHTLLLQHHSKSWEVRCRIQKGTSGTKRLMKGWKQFACDNNLQLGDLCLFELLETKKYTMKVHIIRA